MPEIKQLLGNRLRVEKVQAPTSRGGIYLPEIVRDDANTGGVKEYRVLAVGPGATDRKGRTTPVEAKPGDRVLCHSYTSGPVELDDGTLIITEDLILAILPKQ